MSNDDAFPEKLEREVYQESGVRDNENLFHARRPAIYDFRSRSTRMNRPTTARDSSRPSAEVSPK